MKRNELRKSLEKIKRSLKESQQYTCDLSHTKKEESHFCTCKDAQGHHKMLYPTYKDAQNELDFLKENTLRIYPCPFEKGWHLTKG